MIAETPTTRKDAPPKPPALFKLSGQGEETFDSRHASFRARVAYNPNRKMCAGMLRRSVSMSSKVAALPCASAHRTHQSRFKQPPAR